MEEDNNKISHRIFHHFWRARRSTSTPSLTPVRAGLTSTIFTITHNKLFAKSALLFSPNQHNLILPAHFLSHTFSSLTALDKHDGAHLLTISNDRQGEALLNLHCPPVSPITVRKDLVLNLSTGTVLIPTPVQLRDRPFPDSSLIIKAIQEVITSRPLYSLMFIKLWMQNSYLKQVLSH